MIKEISGWVTTARFGKKVGFIHIVDGSKFGTTQVVLLGEILEQFRNKIGIGMSLQVRGELKESPGPEQPFEVVAEQLEIVGGCDASVYPIQKKDASMEYLRTVPHLRLRTDTFQAIFRVRSVVSQTIHRFFEQEGFMWIHTPIISGSDCEGAGEMFAVGTESHSPQAEVARKLGAVMPLDDESFFGKKAGLTVSGQLEAEAFAQAFGKVYTFGPTFRAENSNTPRHAAEFWMIEPEIAFAQLEDVMSLAERFVIYVVRYLFLHAYDELKFLREMHGKKIEDLQSIWQKPFVRISHQDAQDLLVASGVQFEYPVGRGESLQAEHEKYLCQHFDSPVFVTDYPRLQKAFYMKASEDRETVRCMDLLVPGVGEIIGGSQREEDLDRLIQEMRERGMDLSQLDWYLDLRRFGTTPHGGFGMGLERILMWLTGVPNIRDVIPYPRVPGKLY